MNGKQSPNDNQQGKKMVSQKKSHCDPNDNLCFFGVDKGSAGGPLRLHFGCSFCGLKYYSVLV